MSLEKLTDRELLDRKSTLESQAQGLALQGLEMSEEDTQEYAAIEKELTRRSC